MADNFRERLRARHGVQRGDGERTARRAALRSHVCERHVSRRVAAHRALLFRAGRDLAAARLLRDFNGGPRRHRGFCDGDFRRRLCRDAIRGDHPLPCARDLAASARVGLRRRGGHGFRDRRPVCAPDFGSRRVRFDRAVAAAGAGILRHRFFCDPRAEFEHRADRDANDGRASHVFTTGDRGRARGGYALPVARSPKFSRTRAHLYRPRAWDDSAQRRLSHQRIHLARHRREASAKPPRSVQPRRRAICRRPSGGRDSVLRGSRATEAGLRRGAAESRQRPARARSRGRSDSASRGGVATPALLRKNSP